MVIIYNIKIQKGKNMEKKYLGLKTCETKKQNNENSKAVIGVFILFVITLYGAFSDLNLG